MLTVRRLLGLGLAWFLLSSVSLAAEEDGPTLAFGDDVCCLQLRKTLGRNAPFRQRREPAFASPTRRRGHRGPSAAEARRRRRLDHTANVDESLAGNMMGMDRRLRHRENRRDAGVGAFQQGAPFIHGFGGEPRRDRLPDRGPVGAVRRRRQG